MGLLPQLMPMDVLVLHCPLCSFHSHVLNNIEQHFDEVHPDQIIDYIIYRCAICHKVASCRHFMHEHITLVHNKSVSIDQALGNNAQDMSSKSTSPDSNDLYNSIAFISIYFSGKLYSKSQKLNGFTPDHGQIQESPETRPSSGDNIDERLYKCIFCKSLHNTFQQLQCHYGSHGIRNLGEGSSKEDTSSEEIGGSFLSEKALNIVDNDDNEHENKHKLNMCCKQELKDMYNTSNNCNDNDTNLQDLRPCHTSNPNNCMSIDFLSQSPIKSFNQISTSLQNRSSLFNLIMQQSANQSPQSMSNEEKVSPTNIDNFCSVGLSLPFPISNKVPSLNPRLNGNSWFGGLSPSQLITSPILNSLHSQFGLPSLHQHMMNAYAAVNGGSPTISVSNNGFNCTSPNNLLPGPHIMTTNIDTQNSGNTSGSPPFSNNDLFQVPKGFPSVFSSVMNINGSNSVDNSIDLSSNNNKKSHEKILSSSESDRSSLSLSPSDKYQHLNNRNQQDEHSELSSGNGTNTTDVNNVEESQIYSMKRVVGLSRTNLPFQARKILFGWLTSHLREPYPSEEEKIRLANETGLSRTTVNNWFINARRRYVKPLLQGKLGMTSGVLKSMLENNNGIIHNQRNQFTPNVISSSMKRKSMISNGDNDVAPIVKRRSNNASKGNHSLCVGPYIPDNNLHLKFDYDNYKFEEKVKPDFSSPEIVESSKENRVILEKRLGDSSKSSDIKIDINAKDQNIIPSPYKDLPQELTKGSKEASIDN